MKKLLFCALFVTANCFSASYFRPSLPALPFWKRLFNPFYEEYNFRKAVRESKADERARKNKEKAQEELDEANLSKAIKRSLLPQNELSLDQQNYNLAKLEQTFNRYYASDFKIAVSHDHLIQIDEFWKNLPGGIYYNRCGLFALVHNLAAKYPNCSILCSAHRNNFHSRNWKDYYTNLQLVKISDDYHKISYSMRAAVMARVLIPAFHVWMTEERIPSFFAPGAVLEDQTISEALDSPTTDYVQAEDLLMFQRPFLHEQDVIKYFISFKKFIQSREKFAIFLPGGSLGRHYFAAIKTSQGSTKIVDSLEGSVYSIRK